VPATSFCEYADSKLRKTPTWFALSKDRPLFAFVGRPGAAFAPPVGAPAAASAIDQVVALLGRPPGWSAS